MKSRKVRLFSAAVLVACAATLGGWTAMNEWSPLGYEDGAPTDVLSNCGAWCGNVWRRSALWCDPALGESCCGAYHCDTGLSVGRCCPIGTSCVASYATDPPTFSCN